MTNIWMRTAGLAVVVIVGSAATPVDLKVASAVDLDALRQVQKGEWELRALGRKSSDHATRRICVSDPVQLLQIKRSGGDCSHFVVVDTASHAVITYQCNGSGNGRTDLRVETPRLVQIDVQGISDGAPFAVTFEGRRVGDCR